MGNHRFGRIDVNGRTAKTRRQEDSHKEEIEFLRGLPSRLRVGRGQSPNPLPFVVPERLDSGSNQRSAAHAHS